MKCRCCNSKAKLYGLCVACWRGAMRRGDIALIHRMKP